MSGSQNEKLKYELKKLIIETCRKTVTPESVSDDEPILGSDSVLGLDSLDVLELSVVFKSRYGVRIAAEEMKQLHTMGISEALGWLGERTGVAIQNGEAENIAAALADRLISEVESVGFRASLIDREGVIQQLLQNLNSPKIMEGMVRLFSMGSLVDFISTRVGEKTQ